MGHRTCSCEKEMKYGLCSVVDLRQAILSRID